MSRRRCMMGWRSWWIGFAMWNWISPIRRGGSWVESYWGYHEGYDLEYITLLWLLQLPLLLREHCASPHYLLPLPLHYQTRKYQSKDIQSLLPSDLVCDLNQAWRPESSWVVHFRSPFKDAVKSLALQYCEQYCRCNPHTMQLGPLFHSFKNEKWLQQSGVTQMGTQDGTNQAGIGSSGLPIMRNSGDDVASIPMAWGRLAENGENSTMELEVSVPWVLRKGSTSWLIHAWLGKGRKRTSRQKFFPECFAYSLVVLPYCTTTFCCPVVVHWLSHQYQSNFSYVVVWYGLVTGVSILKANVKIIQLMPDGTLTPADAQLRFNHLPINGIWKGVNQLW